VKNLHFLTHQEIFDQAVNHLFSQARAALLPRGGGAYKSYCGGCPVGSFIMPLDYTSSMEGVPVRYINRELVDVPDYMEAGAAALKKALLRARINVFNPATVSLLSCLQNAHDAFGNWEWKERLVSIAHQFDLSAELVKRAA
jgi:hypothetical protein